MSTEVPGGVGLYIRELSASKHGTPAQAAKKAADHNVSFVAIMTAWQDLRGSRPHFKRCNGADGQKIKRYAEAFTARGIHVWLWGFPRGGGEEQFVDRFVDVNEVCGPIIRGWLWDPELYYKWSRPASAAGPVSMRGQPEFSPTASSPVGSAQTRKAQAQKLVNLTLDAMNESLGLGITSYGMAGFHKNFPWSVFGGVGWGSPQLYSVGPQQVDRGIRQWRAHGWDTIIPSVPTFGKKSGGAKLHDHLSNFVDGDENISGFIFWSWRQTQADEWRILARWAAWFEGDRVAIG